jgi:hypothetical protein
VDVREETRDTHTGGHYDNTYNDFIYNNFAYNDFTFNDFSFNDFAYNDKLITWNTGEITYNYIT